MKKPDSIDLGSSPKSLGSQIEAADALQELGEMPGRYPVKRRIETAAKRAGFDYWRAFDIWYRKARKIDRHELDAIAEALTQKRKEANRNELHELQVRLARLESLLAQADADFYRPQITALRDQRRGMDRKRGSPDSALA